MEGNRGVVTRLRRVPGAYWGPIWLPRSLAQISILALAPKSSVEDRYFTDGKCMKFGGIEDVCRAGSFAVGPFSPG